MTHNLWVINFLVVLTVSSLKVWEALLGRETKEFAYKQNLSRNTMVSKLECVPMFWKEPI